MKNWLLVTSVVLVLFQEIKVSTLKYADNSHPLKHDDYLTEFEQIISSVFLVNYLSPKLHRESYY